MDPLNYRQDFSILGALFFTMCGAPKATLSTLHALLWLTEQEAGKSCAGSESLELGLCTS